jgi:hypothetical protein
MRSCMICMALSTIMARWEVGTTQLIVRTLSIKNGISLTIRESLKLT